MKTFRLLPFCIAFASCLCLLMVSNDAGAQATASDTAKKVPIEVVKASTLQVIETDSGSINKLIGDVVLKQGDSYMYCDSSYLNLRTNSLEAFGNVQIMQPGSQGTSDYLRYTGNNRHAYMRGSVNLTDNKDNLWSEEVDYDMAGKIGTYNLGGTLQSGTTTVSSRSGIYNMRTKDARFMQDVIVTDPQYHMTSQDLGYNTETKVVTFFSPSVVTSDSSILKTSCGTYDTKFEIAHFTCRASILNKEQYLEADTIDYNRTSGAGTAIGNVIAIDTTQHTTLYSGRADYNEKQRTMLATIKPVLKQLNGKDSLFIRADTLFSAPVPVKTDTAADKAATKGKGSIKASGKETKALDKKRNRRQESAVNSRDTIHIDPLVPDTDTVLNTNIVMPIPDTMADMKDTSTLVNIRRKALPAKPIDTISSKRKGMEKASVATDSTDKADSSRPRYFIGYHHVLIFSDSMQGRCDSISYSQEDSVMRMMYDPILWSRNSQITGDTILLYTDSGKLNRMYVPNNAFVISQSGPEKAKLFDQVQGKTLTAYFVDNTINDILVMPDAQTIYYSKDDNGAYLGVNEASSSEKLRIFFKDQQIDRIFFGRDVKQKMTPLDKADLPAMKLSRYQWRPQLRPRSLEELFK